MGCLLYLVLHALKHLNSDVDTPIFCILFALDSHLAFRVWLYHKYHR